MKYKTAYLSKKQNHIDLVGIEMVEKTVFFSVFGDELSYYKPITNCVTELISQSVSCYLSHKMEYLTWLF